MKGDAQMQKIFFISNNSQKVSAGVQAPHLDRFQRVEQLNEMLSRGWSIKEFKSTGADSYFVLEKEA